MGNRHNSCIDSWRYCYSFKLARYIRNKNLGIEKRKDAAVRVFGGLNLWRDLRESNAKVSISSEWLKKVTGLTVHDVKRGLATLDASGIISRQRVNTPNGFRRLLNFIAPTNNWFTAGEFVKLSPAHANGLSFVDYLLFGFIDLAEERGRRYASWRQLAEVTAIDRRTVSAAIGRLSGRGLIVEDGRLYTTEAYERKQARTHGRAERFRSVFR